MMVTQYAAIVFVKDASIKGYNNHKSYKNKIVKNNYQLYCEKCGWRGNKKNIKPITNSRGDTRRLWRCPRCSGKLDNQSEHDKW